MRTGGLVEGNERIPSPRDPQHNTRTLGLKINCDNGFTARYRDGYYQSMLLRYVTNETHFTIDVDLVKHKAARARSRSNTTWTCKARVSDSIALKHATAPLASRRTRRKRQPARARARSSPESLKPSRASSTSSRPASHAPSWNAHRSLALLSVTDQAQRSAWPSSGIPLTAQRLSSRSGRLGKRPTCRLWNDDDNSSRSDTSCRRAQPNRGIFSIDCSRGEGRCIVSIFRAVYDRIQNSMWCRC